MGLPPHVSRGLDHMQCSFCLFVCTSGIIAYICKWAQLVEHELDIWLRFYDYWFQTASAQASNCASYARVCACISGFLQHSLPPFVPCHLSPRPRRSAGESPDAPQTHSMTDSQWSQTHSMTDSIIVTSVRSPRIVECRQMQTVTSTRDSA